MLKTAFIGSENFFDRRLCEWLSEHTELNLIIWTNNLSWAQTSAKDRKRRIIKRFINRARRKGILTALNELVYYAIYGLFLGKRETLKIRKVVEATTCNPRKALSEIRQLKIHDINSPELLQLVASQNLDAIFAMCIDVYLPQNLINAPKHGAFLWHEGITPEYRGVYSPFWALVNKEYDCLGYTLLKMNAKFDAGAIFVQGKARDIDPQKDWHSFIGHKAILDSLPEVEKFLATLENQTPKPIVKQNAIDRCYSYPTATALLKIVARRFFV